MAKETRIIAMSSQKGGVGKTTSCLNLSAELAASGHNVLMVDLDPQGHLAEGLGIASAELKHEMSEVLLRQIPITDIIINVRENLDLAPANIRLANTESLLFQASRREDRLKQALEAVRGCYDVIMIDCPPSLGNLTVNAFSAATDVLIPMSLEFYSLLGVQLLLDSIGNARVEINPDLKLIGIIPTRLKRTTHATAVLEKAHEDWPDVRIFETPIPEAVAVQNSVAAGQPLREYEPNSPATKAYHKIAKEL
jgi:chromosome partitioning protein